MSRTAMDAVSCPKVHNKNTAIEIPYQQLSHVNTAGKEPLQPSYAGIRKAVAVDFFGQYTTVCCVK